MFILPLHKRPTVANFPVATLLLILANVFVFAFLQSGDSGVQERAFAYWRASGLVELELPAYVESLRARGETELADFIAEAEEPMRSELGFRAVNGDAEFAQAVARREALPASHPQHTQWLTLRGKFDAIRDEAFTERYYLKYADLAPERLLGSMFLHGDAGHLVGNMVILAFLGLLLEGALGSRLYVVVYLLGGIGGSLFTLARHYGEPSGALGASGAIAALMGAYCVVWGLRKVRFFYWFFFVFDYVKAPALVLLPAWLGWELANMWLNPDAGVSFDGHAGGIMAGALLALGVRTLGWEKREFLDEDERRDAEADLRERAFAHFGRLEFARARPLLAELLQLRPDDFEATHALYRSWRPEPNRDEFHDAARRVLVHPSNVAADLQRIREVSRDYVGASAGNVRLSNGEALSLARRFTLAGAGPEAEQLLELLGTRDPTLAGVPEAWLALALRMNERRDAVATARLLKRLAERYPGSPAATKAEFLLANA